MTAARVTMRPIPAPPPLVIRGFSVTLPVAQLASPDVPSIAEALTGKVAQAGDLFRDAPIVIDLKEVGDVDVDLGALVTAFRAHGMQPVAVGNASARQQDAARGAGLAILSGGRTSGRDAAPARPEAPTEEPVAPRLVTNPVRSGQRVYVAHGDLVVIGQVNTGSEVLAAGNVHVYGPLHGRAVAGVRGDTTARILTTCFAAQLVAIAGVYRALDDDVPAEVREKPAQVFLVGDRLVIEPLAVGGEHVRKTA
ncbi:septum site-determining protein MinC [Candidatus Binatia bacterium]|nr:septum site-determining protein MinC [Candidatus Binatia bacterium]